MSKTSNLRKLFSQFFFCLVGATIVDEDEFPVGEVLLDDRPDGRGAQRGVRPVGPVPAAGSGGRAVALCERSALVGRGRGEREWRGVARSGGRGRRAAIGRVPDRGDTRVGVRRRPAARESRTA